MLINYLAFHNVRGIHAHVYMYRRLALFYNLKRVELFQVCLVYDERVFEVIKKEREKGFDVVLRVLIMFTRYDTNV